MEGLTSSEIAGFGVGALLVCATIAAQRVDGFIASSQRTHAGGGVWRRGRGEAACCAGLGTPAWGRRPGGAAGSGEATRDEARRRRRHAGEAAVERRRRRRLAAACRAGGEVRRLAAPAWARRPGRAAGSGEAKQRRRHAGEARRR